MSVRFETKPRSDEPLRQRRRRRMRKRRRRRRRGRRLKCQEEKWASHSKCCGKRATVPCASP